MNKELTEQEDDIEQLALASFKAAMQFCHTDFSDIAYNRFRTWYSQNKTSQSKQKESSERVYTDDDLDVIISMAGARFSQKEKEMGMDDFIEYIKTEFSKFEEKMKD